MAKILLVTVVVLMAFQDKFDHKTQYAPGTELQVEKERADDLVSRGLAKMKEEALSKAPADKKPKQSKGVPPAANPGPAENAGQEVAAENAAPPAGDNSEEKQEDEPGTEE